VAQAFAHGEADSRAANRLCEVGAIRGRCAWMKLILAAAGHDAELVRVADGALPPDLRLTRAMSQHFIASSAKAMSLLDWSPTPTAAAVASSVRWHLENPPAEGDAPDFAADDAVLASVG
jgi:hypothetical protein